MKYKNMNDSVYVKNSGDILACRYYHSFAYPDGVDAIGDCGAEKVDGKNWDVFHIHYETENAYYGVPMLGFGLINCMILKSDTRPFLENELQYNVGMFGSHTYKFINGQKIKIKPIKNKF